MKKIITNLSCMILALMLAGCTSNSKTTDSVPVSNNASTKPLHTHDWRAATCTNPKTCTTCGEITGEAIGHDWRAATCTKPKTCTTCGETVGEAVGHDWRAATCTEAKWCSACGKTEGVALGHDDNGSGVCTRCGIQLYNPAPDSAPTFLYTHSGTISISAANISLQDSAVLYVTLSYAGSVSYDCEPSNVITLSWGQFDYSGTVPLYITANQNGTAQIRIYETYYPDNYLTVNVTVSNHASVDTSTASGILASMGMTEEQFRSNCIYIGSEYNKRNSYVYAAGREYYTAHPDENTMLDRCTEEWLDYCANGTKADSYDDYTAWYFDNSSCLDDYLNYKIYGPKGASILGKQSKEYLIAMREYPNEYINCFFLLKKFNVEYSANDAYTNSSYVVYEMPIMVIDYRDDTTNPNILTGYHYYDMYVIFVGTYRTLSGEVGLQFALISLDRSNET